MTAKRFVITTALILCLAGIAQADHGLKFDSATNQWVWSNDAVTWYSFVPVVVTSPSDGQVLAYNATTGTWTNQTPPASGVSAVTASAPLSSSGGSTPNISLGSGYYMPTTTDESNWNAMVPNTRTVNGHALSSNVTVSATDVGLGNVINQAHDALANLTDASISSPSDSQVLVYSASAGKWQNQTSGAGVTLGSTAPPAADGKSSAGSASTAMRSDAKVWNYQLELETAFEQLLQGTLSTGTPAWVSGTTYSIGNNVLYNSVAYTCVATGGSWTAAPSSGGNWAVYTVTYSMTGSGSGPYTPNGNQGVRTLKTPGNWTQYATYESTTTVSETWTIVFRTTGGTITLTCPSGLNSSDGFSVTLDGNSQSAWAQNVTTYTLTSVAAGIHTLVLTYAGGGVGEMSTINIPQLPYQGVGVNGDTVEALYIPSWMFATSIDTGATNNGATYNSSMYGETVMSRLPIGTTCPDSNMARDSCALSGITDGGATGMKRIPLVSGLTSGYRVMWATGAVVPLNYTQSGGRGLGSYITNGGWLDYGFSFASSAYRGSYLPMLGKVTATGTGSVLSAGQIVLLVIGGPPSSNATAISQVYTAALSGAAPYAADVFVLP